MGRNCYGPKLTWADFVMGRNDPEPIQQKHKTKIFWLNFCLNKECPNILWTGYWPQKGTDYSNMNSSGGKGILQGITVCLVSVELSTM